MTVNALIQVKNNQAYKLGFDHRYGSVNTDIGGVLGFENYIK